MTTRFQLRTHSLKDGASVLDVFADGEFIAAVYGLDDPGQRGIRVISKYVMTLAKDDSEPGAGVTLITFERVT